MKQRVTMCGVGCGEPATLRGMCDTCRRALAIYAGKDETNMNKSNTKADTKMNENNAARKKSSRKSKAEKEANQEAVRLAAVAKAEKEAAEGALSSYKEEPGAEESDLDDENAARGITELTEESTEGGVEDLGPESSAPETDLDEEAGDVGGEFGPLSSEDPPALVEAQEDLTQIHAAAIAEPGDAPKAEPAKLVTNRRGMISALEWIEKNIPKWDWSALGLDQNAVCGLAITAGNYAKRAVFTKRTKPTEIEIGSVVRPRSEKMRADLAGRFGATFTVNAIDGEWADTTSATGKTLPFKLKQIELVPAEVAS